MVSKKKKDKPMIKMLVPDAQHMQHFTNALGITNHIRKQQKMPALGMEKFALQALIAASNDVLGWYQKQLDEQQNKTQEGASDVNTQRDDVSSTDKTDESV
jgi:hypothetical protein